MVSIFSIGGRPLRVILRLTSCGSKFAASPHFFHMLCGSHHIFSVQFIQRTIISHCSSNIGCERLFSYSG